MSVRSLTRFGIQFGKAAVDAFTQGGTSYQCIAYSGVYHWWYTIRMRTNNDLMGAVFLLLLAALFLFAGWHLQPKFSPNLPGFEVLSRG